MRISVYVISLVVALVAIAVRMTQPDHTAFAAPAMDDPAPDLSLTKTHIGDFWPNSLSVFTLTVSNSPTAGPTTGPITVTDTLPTGLTYSAGVGGLWSCSADGRIVTCTDDSVLVAGASSSFSLIVSAASDAPASIENRAHVTTPGDSNVENNSASDTVTVIQPPPDLHLTKTHVGRFAVRTNGTFTMTVSNGHLGGMTTNPIIVTDTLPAGLTFVSGGGTGWTCDAVLQTVTCTNPGPLAPLASSSFTLTVAVGQAAFPTVQNRASVDSGGDRNDFDNTATDTVLVDPAQAPDLTIIKTHTGNFVVGAHGLFTIQVINNLVMPTTGPITVTDTLPAGLTFVSWTGTGWTCSAVEQTVTCTHPAVLGAPGATVLGLTVAVGSAALPSVQNQASVSTPGEFNLANNSSTRIVPVGLPPDLSLTKTHTGNFVSGGTGVFTLTVSNGGSAGPTTGTIAVTDTLPSGLTYLSGTGAGWTCSNGGQTVTCTRSSTLAPGASSTIALTTNVSAAAAASVVNQATVATTTEVNVANNTASDTVTTIGRGSCPQVLHPNISVVTTANGDGRLRATITVPALDVGLTNAVQQIVVTSRRNARVDVVGGAADLSDGVAFVPPTASLQIVLLISRVVPSGDGTVGLTVQDTCGSWTTFVGGGPNAWGP